MKNHNWKHRAYLTAVFILIFGHTAYAKLPTDEQAIKAILGEVGPWGKKGMQCVASAIRNRNNELQGIYGHKNPNVVNKLYTQKQYEDAVSAWQQSKLYDYSQGAMHWFSDADLKQAKVQRIIREDKLVFIKREGRNNFYRRTK